MMGDAPCCFGHGVGSAIEKHGALFPFEHVSDTLSKGDIVFGNLEIVLSQHNRSTEPFSAIEWRAQPEAVQGLVKCGFDKLNVATNHTMEHGQSALEETLDLLAENDMKYVGVDIPERNITRCCVFEISGIKFCCLGYNFRPQQYFIDPPSWPEFFCYLKIVSLMSGRIQKGMIPCKKKIVSGRIGAHCFTALAVEISPEVTVGRPLLDAHHIADNQPLAILVMQADP